MITDKLIVYDKRELVMQYGNMRCINGLQRTKPDLGSQVWLCHLERSTNDCECVPECTIRYFYDLVTSLGSNLEIKSTKVSLSDTEPVDIPEQDFGFDIVNGKTSVDISTGN